MSGVAREPAMGRPHPATGLIKRQSPGSRHHTLQRQQNVKSLKRVLLALFNCVVCQSRFRHQKISRVMDSKLILFAFMALFCAAARAGTVPSLGDVLTGEDKEEAAEKPAVELQPIDDEQKTEDEATADESTADAEGEEQESAAGYFSGARRRVYLRARWWKRVVQYAIVMAAKRRAAMLAGQPGEAGSGDEEDSAPVSSCQDISGVWTTKTSPIKLVLQQNPDQSVTGIFVDNAASTWYEVHGFRGDSEDSAFGVIAIRDEVKGATAASGVCLPCSGSLILNIVDIAPHHKECKTFHSPVLDRQYQRTDTAEAAANIIRDFLPEESIEESSGDE